MNRVLVVTAVQQETEAIRIGCGADHTAMIVTGGIGRTNAAAATTQAILESGPFDHVISAGIAGSLPGSGLIHGDVVVSDACIYAEEGIMTLDGFRSMSDFGFSLGNFVGNVIQIDETLVSRYRDLGHIGRIATVATCSGTDVAAAEVVRRTSALAEAMEGAAVVHAARRLGVSAIEIRSISNTTGNRERQVWRIDDALKSLTRVFARFPIQARIRPARG